MKKQKHKIRMTHHSQYLEVDSAREAELFLEWIETDNETPYQDWLQLKTYDLCKGGASNSEMELLKKTIAVLVHETKKSK